MIMFPNLNSLLALPTLIASGGNSARQELNQGIYHDKRPI
jgi:hypothetical protein